MGFILASGVQASLRAALPWPTSNATLRSLAERIAAGTTLSSDQSAPAAVVHKALVDGFSRVMLYGWLSVWILAGISFVVFGAGKSARPSAKKACVPAS